MIDSRGCGRRWIGGVVENMIETAFLCGIVTYHYEYKQQRYRILLFCISMQNFHPSPPRPNEASWIIQYQANNPPPVLSCSIHPIPLVSRVSIAHVIQLAKSCPPHILLYIVCRVYRLNWRSPQTNAMVPLLHTRYVICIYGHHI